MNESITHSRKLPGLDALRGFAALTVVVCHVDRLKLYMELPTFDSEIAVAAARNAVTCFFVLSGFLITFLLLAEKQTVGSIDIPKFYVRRCLRIWPLYFVVLIAGFLIAPRLWDFPLDGNRHIDDPLQVGLFLFFLPNVALAIYGSITYLSPLWSIGLEEQFYLVWPWIVRRLTPRRLLVFLCVFSVCVAVSRVLVLRYAGVYLSAPLTFLLTTAEFDSMAVGGIAAVLFFGRSRYVRRITSPTTQFMALGALAALTFTGDAHRYASVVVLSCSFAVVILGLSAGGSVSTHLEGSVYRHLGKISYGVYLLHTFVIVGLLNTPLAARQNQISGVILLYAGSLVGTVALASLSYHVLERPFLKLKDRFSVLAPSPRFVPASAEQPIVASVV
jgi:peptidoglycan/LPS O-acetylase OafA/YrhL